MERPVKCINVTADLKSYTHYGVGSCSGVIDLYGLIALILCVVNITAVEIIALID